MQSYACKLDAIKIVIQLRNLAMCRMSVDVYVTLLQQLSFVKIYHILRSYTPLPYNWLLPNVWKDFGWKDLLCQYSFELRKNLGRPHLHERSSTATATTTTTREFLRSEIWLAMPTQHRQRSRGASPIRRLGYTMHFCPAPATLTSVDRNREQHFRNYSSLTIHCVSKQVVRCCTRTALPRGVTVSGRRYCA